MASITQGAATPNLACDRPTRPEQRILPTAISVSMVWSHCGARLLTNLVSFHNGDTFDRHAYLVDRVGNITQDANSVTGLTWNYTDDDLYRLTQATLGTSTYSWVYDLAGNRLSQNAAGVTTAYGVDANNRMVSVNGAPVAYDANGNMTAFGGEALTWDVRNRLVSLTAPGVTDSFVYDYAGRRVSKTSNGTHTSLLNDADNVVSEITNGTVINTLQSPFVDEPIARGGLYFTPNHLGSTTTLTDGSGNVAEQYFYLPFGQTGQSAGTSSPFQFTGRENDGTGLYFYRNRYYSPDLGRFISEDPLGSSAGADGATNRYSYASGDPVNAIDPYGLFHLVATINPDDPGQSTAKVFADPGDVIPAPPLLASLGITPMAAQGGELVGTIDIGNAVSHPDNPPSELHHGGPHDPSGFGPFPVGEFPITGFRAASDHVRYGQWVILIGTGKQIPAARLLRIHAGRSGYWCTTNGCLRVDKGVLDWLVELIEANPGGHNRITVINPSQDDRSKETLQ